MTGLADRNRALSVAEAASLLNVSDATIRNWIKAGLLANAAGPGRSAVDRDEAARFLARLGRSGPNGKLRSRANKTRSGQRRLPRRGAGAGATRRVAAIAAAARAARLRPAETLCLTAIRWAVSRGFFAPALFDRLVRDGQADEGENFLFRELHAFCAPLRRNPPSAAKNLLTCPLPDVDDVLGLVYQALLSERARTARGLYYTASHVAEAIANDLYRPGLSILDPCCGSGAFLAAFAKAGAPPETLHGFDLDPVAVCIARLNLLARWPDHDFSEQIVRRDALAANTTGKAAGEQAFDLVATNPPWGARLTPDRLGALRAAYPKIASRETFSFFLLRALDFLAPQGRGSFVLPESFLNTNRHRDIRNALATRARIDQVAPLDRVFGEVFTPAVRVDFAICPQGAESGAGKRFFAARGDGDSRLVAKLLRPPRVFLAGNADWAVGIVTGDNRRHLSDRPGPGLEPIFRGRDLAPFRFGPPTAYIRFQPKAFQQTAPEAVYRSSEKLVYRFVSRRLVFAVDRDRRLTLNSANIVIPRLASHSPMTIAALFNSAPYQFLHATLFHGLKVLRGQLERLPLPLWDDDVLAAMAELAERLTAGEGDPAELDELVMREFGLSAGDRARVAAVADGMGGKRDKYYGNPRSLHL